MGDLGEGIENSNGIEPEQEILPEAGPNYVRLIVRESDTESEGGTRYPAYTVDVVDETESETEEEAEHGEGAEHREVAEHGEGAEHEHGDGAEHEHGDGAEHEHGDGAEHEEEAEHEHGEGAEHGESIVHDTDTDPGDNTGYTEYIVEEVESETEEVIELQVEPELEEVEPDDSTVYGEDLRTEFELRLIDHDGRNLCHGIYPESTTVGALKRRVVDEWPQGVVSAPTSPRQVTLIHGGRILQDNYTLANFKTIFRNTLPRGTIVVLENPHHYALAPFSEMEASV